ncbi:hypothetical protein [Duganella sp. Leaf61]|uniref:hypothetical protein n=1 Tax=Duganella sp. Leaf61 TaxID=1736227 RepID=UPI000A535D71|nr:hypothetical protein [Duganella sp. Leaf61]
MASPSLPPRLLFTAGAVIAVLIGVGVYVSNSTPEPAPAVPAQPAPIKPLPTPPATPPAAKPAPRPPAAVEPAAPAEPKVTRTKDQASAALLALPELRAWSTMLEKTSNGKVHGALIEYDPAPRKLNGKTYYQFSFVENSADAALRWESFLVSANDDEILVEDATNDEVISLARWRREKHPEKRTSVDG